MLTEEGRAALDEVGRFVTSPLSIQALPRIFFAGETMRGENDGLAGSYRENFHHIRSQLVS
jgi:hypothetical protein